MRIAVWHNLPSGGGKRALYYHIRGLLERGHVVEAWCPPTADQRYLPLGNLIPEHVIPISSEVRTATTLWGKLNEPIESIMWPYRNMLARLTAMDRHSLMCAEEINAGRFDVLLSHPCMEFRVTSIGRYVNIPKVLYLQEPFRWLYEALPRLPWLALPPWGGRPWSPRRLQRAIYDAVRLYSHRIQAREELLNARAFNVILVNSFFSRESVLRSYGLDAQVCYLGIDTELFNDYHLDRDNFVIGVGAFVPEKNIEFIIDALGAIKSRRPRLLWIGNVGAADYMRHLERRAAELGVEFVPMLAIDDQALIQYLNYAQAMVYAPRLEPFGFAPLEANACGLPVVAVAEGGVRETVLNGVNGLLVGGGIREMSAAIERLVKDPVNARNLGENGRRLVLEKWTLDSAIDRLEERLDQAVEAPTKDNGTYA